MQIALKIYPKTTIILYLLGVLLLEANGLNFSDQTDSIDFIEDVLSGPSSNPLSRRLLRFSEKLERDVIRGLKEERQAIRSCIEMSKSTSKFFSSWNLLAFAESQTFSGMHGKEPEESTTVRSLAISDEELEDRKKGIFLAIGKRLGPLETSIECLECSAEQLDELQQTCQANYQGRLDKILEAMTSVERRSSTHIKRAIREQIYTIDTICEGIDGYSGKLKRVQERFQSRVLPKLKTIGTFLGWEKQEASSDLKERLSKAKELSESIDSAQRVHPDLLGAFKSAVLLYRITIQRAQIIYHLHLRTSYLESCLLPEADRPYQASNAADAADRWDSFDSQIAIAGKICARYKEKLLHLTEHSADSLSAYDRRQVSRRLLSDIFVGSPSLTRQTSLDSNLSHDTNFWTSN